jgi:alkylation response protein AidB-like acyl-CoA dehydrogenase
MQTGREDLSLARLAEAHWDAVAILAEAARPACPGCLYGVWASEVPGRGLQLRPVAAGYVVSGTKLFCSGAGIVDRALVTVTHPESYLVELDVGPMSRHTVVDLESWKTDAFRMTRTGTVSFEDLPVQADAIIATPGWYVERPGFWHGACGPAACWAGGALGLLDFALLSRREDSHTLAHLGGILSDVWALRAYLTTAGDEIDANPQDREAAQIRALTVRHLVEQACSDVLRRFSRAYGPGPLTMDQDIARRCQELEVYLRQSHAERDMEALARACRQTARNFSSSSGHVQHE